MKSVIAHGLLALFGLVFAYQTWTKEEKPELNAGEVIISECDASKLSSIQIETPSHTATYAAKRSGGPVEYWITTQAKPKEDKPADKPKSDDKAAKLDKTADKTADKTVAKTAANDDKANPKPVEPAKPETPKQPRAYDPDAPVNFLANTKFDEALKTLAPLHGARKLGEIPKSKWKEFGLEKPTFFLREECGGKKLTLEVGGRTYGTGDQYARDPKSNQVYLVRGQMLMDLQSAMYKFMQTDLHNWTLPEIDEAVIKAGGKERHLLHRNRQVPAEAAWVDAAAPDKRNELFGNWFQRLSKLKSKAYLGEGKEPGSDLQVEVVSTTPVVTVEYNAEGKQKGKFELARVDTKQGNFYYARTEASHRWTVMYDSIAKQVEEDVAMVVDAEQKPAEKPSQAVSPELPPAQSVTPATTGAPRLPPSHPPIH